MIKSFGEFFDELCARVDELVDANRARRREIELVKEQLEALEKMVVDTYATKGPPEGGMRLG